MVLGDDFYNFHKTLEHRRPFGEYKKIDIRNTIHIVPGLQNIDFDDFEIVYTSRLMFTHIVEFPKDHFPLFVNSIAFYKDLVILNDFIYFN